MLQSISRSIVLAGKELKIFFKDFQMLFFSLALPLVFTFLMAAAFGGQTEFHTVAYIVNLDRGTAGTELIERLQAVDVIDVELLGTETAEQKLEDAGIVNLITIEEDFSQELSSGESPQILIRQRGTGGTESQIVNSYVESIALELVGEQTASRQVKSMLTAVGADNISKTTVTEKVKELFAHYKNDPVVEITEEAVGARSDVIAVYLPGLVTMFILFSISLTSVSLVEERKNGTLERLITTRISRGELLLGNWLSSFTRGLIQIIFLFGISSLFFSIFSAITFISVLAFGTIAVLAASGIGLVIAAISRTPEQANWIAVFFTMIMTTLGGSFFDTSGLTGIMGLLTKATYNFWANDGFRRIILRGDSLFNPAIGKDILVLLGIGVLSWAFALALFRLRGDEK